MNGVTSPVVVRCRSNVPEKVFAFTGWPPQFWCMINKSEWKKNTKKTRERQGTSNLTSTTASFPLVLRCFRPLIALLSISASVSRPRGAPRQRGLAAHDHPEAICRGQRGGCSSCHVPRLLHKGAVSLQPRSPSQMHERAPHGRGRPFHRPAFGSGAQRARVLS